MANNWFLKGVEGFAAGDIDFDANQFKCILLDANNAGPAANAYMVSTHDNAATVTITTSAAHGLTAGDRVTIKGVVDTMPTVAVTTAYALGALVKTGTTRLRAVKAGTSAGSAPTYNTTAGDYTVDGSVVWKSEGAGVADSILNYGAWDATRNFALGYWTVNTVPLTTTFTIVLPNAPGTFTSGGYIMNLSKTFLSDVAGVAGAQVARSTALASKTNAGGTLSCAQIDFGTVTGAVSEAVLLCKTAATAGADDADSAIRVVGYYDSLGLLPVTPNGGQITWTPSPNLGTI